MVGVLSQEQTLNSSTMIYTDDTKPVLSFASEFAIEVWSACVYVATEIQI